MRLFPSAERLVLGAVSIVESDDDPDNTMQVAITHRDLASCVFGIVLITQLFPELAGTLLPTLDKFRELADFQNFLPSEREG